MNLNTTEIAQLTDYYLVKLASGQANTEVLADSTPELVQEGDLKTVVAITQAIAKFNAGGLNKWIFETDTMGEFTIPAAGFEHAFRGAIEFLLGQGESFAMVKLVRVE